MAAERRTDSATPSASADAAPAALEKIRFADLPGWPNDDHAAAFRAFRNSAAGALPKTRGLGIDGARFAGAFEASLSLTADPPPDEARAFFERNFRPHRIQATGFVTGYYEPEVEASAVRTERFGLPLYRRPPELVEVDERNRPAGWDPDIRFAANYGGRILPFADRRAIDHGYLDGRGLEIAFLADPVDAFFIHVQGSARLRMTDGSVRRIGFAGKSGHAYTSIGRLAVERGLLTREGADKAGLETWLKADPLAARALMHENRSYIFFKEIGGLSAADGPVGAAGVSLTPLRSLAVDRTLMTFHTPVWVEALELGFRHLMIAQDTGSAIVGPARGDIFFGSGGEAGRQAGAVRHAAAMVALVPAGQGEGGQ
jgi:membrane-bound lytic murein transglycosylase A